MLWFDLMSCWTPVHARGAVAMKLIAEYLERCAHFERLAASENDLSTQAQMLEQARAYYKLAVKRAGELGQAIPPPPASVRERTPP